MGKFFSNHPLTVVVLSGLLIILGALLIAWVFQPTMDAIEWREEKYIVTEGDSLWEISYEYVPRGVDRREWIDEIKALNDLPNSNIRTGQKLIVLAPVE